MSAALLDALLPYVRSQFTKREVMTVEEYGGQFNSDEVAQISFNCPAIFIAVLGWKPEPAGPRLAGKHVRSVSLAAFVVTKHAQRELRMRSAMQIADKLAVALRLWVPSDDVQAAAAACGYTIGPLEAAPTCENLYGRGVDAKGQAMWLLSWEQALAPTLPEQQLYELLRIDVFDQTHQGNTPAAAPLPPNSAPLVVTEDVTFAAVAGV